MVGFLACRTIVPPCFDMKLCDMELTGIKNRPEAFKAGLDHINSINDLNRLWSSDFPKVTGRLALQCGRRQAQFEKRLERNRHDGLFRPVRVGLQRLGLPGIQVENRHDPKRHGPGGLGDNLPGEGRGLEVLRCVDQLKAIEELLCATGKVLKIQRERTSKESQDKLALAETEADLLELQSDKAKALGDAHATLAELTSTMGTNYNETHVE